MDDWYDKIDYLKDSFLDLLDMVANPPKRLYGTESRQGDVCFLRLKKHKSRHRYFMTRTDEYGRPRPTNVMILYQKSRRAWAIFLLDPDIRRYSITRLDGSEQDPVKRYRTLSAAKMSLMSNPLDRVGAETDAICEATSGSEKSLNADSCAPPN